MKLRTSLAIAAVTATGLVVGIAAPASAADTDATFTLTGGSLTVTAAADAPALTGGATTVDEKIISGTLGAVTVTDSRGVTTVWNASASSTVFTGTNLSTSTGVSYTAGAVTKTGTITVADGTATVLPLTPAAGASVVAPGSLSGNNTASWNPTLNVTMPAGALAGGYSGTVTTSVA